MWLRGPCLPTARSPGKFLEIIRINLAAPIYPGDGFTGAFLRLSDNRQRSVADYRFRARAENRGTVIYEARNPGMRSPSSALQPWSYPRKLARGIPKEMRGRHCALTRVVRAWQSAGEGKSFGMRREREREREQRRTCFSSPVKIRSACISGDRFCPSLLTSRVQHRYTR
jgi:hypothetical protein